MVPQRFFEQVYETDLSTVEFPPDLLPWIVKLRGVMRFVNDVYPSGAIVNDGFEHTGRLVIAASLVLDAASRPYGCRMGCLHDLHESVGLKDYTLIELTANKGLRRQKRNEELSFAREYLSDTDQRIIAYYNMAGDFIREGRGDLREIPYIAMIVKLLDIIEGDVTLHRSLSAWAAGDAYDADLMPRRKDLLLGLCNSRELQERFTTLDHTSSELGLELLHATERYIGQLWCGIDLRRVPRSIREFYNF
jgi:hypothetical protein